MGICRGGGGYELPTSCSTSSSKAPSAFLVRTACLSRLCAPCTASAPPPRDGIWPLYPGDWGFSWPPIWGTGIWPIYRGRLGFLIDPYVGNWDLARLPG